MSSEIKRTEKEKEKENKKKKEKIATLCLETRAQSEGFMVKAFKARYLKPSLVGSRRFSVRYTGGWVEFSEL